MLFLTLKLYSKIFFQKLTYSFWNNECLAVNGSPGIFLYLMKLRAGLEFLTKNISMEKITSFFYT